MLPELLQRVSLFSVLHRMDKDIAEHNYRHPHQEELVRFGASAIERRYYQALHADNPAISREGIIHSRKKAGELFKQALM